MTPLAPTNPTALVTGAARRIGKHLAMHLHGQGYHVVIHYHQSEQAAKALMHTLLAERPESASLWQQDWRDPQLSSAAASLGDRYPQLQLVVHNAARFQPDATLMAEGQTDTLRHCNAIAPDIINQALHSILQHNHGQIIHITDSQGDKHLPGYTHYLQSKQALHTLTKRDAIAYAPAIRVHAIALGPIIAPEGPHADQLKSALRRRRNPLQHEGTPQDICHALDYLLRATHSTGQVLHIDGGLHLES